MKRLDIRVGKYVFILKDKDSQALTKEIYYNHIEHLRQCTREGTLFMAGLACALGMDGIEVAREKWK